MTDKRITINGQQYDSPEAMPPDVRRTYEAAMRTVGPSLASGQVDGSTQVFTGRAGQLGASVVVNWHHHRERSQVRERLPFDPASTESRLRSLPMSLAITIAIALVLWALLGR